MSFSTDRIKQLQQEAIKWSFVPDCPEKTMFGFWLHGELAHLTENGLVKDEDRVDFLATVKILIEQILPPVVDEEL